MSALLPDGPIAFRSAVAFRAWLHKHRPGLAAFEARSEARTGVYSFERAAMTLSPVAARRFKAEKAAWKYFQGEAPWYRRVCIFWVMSAKREETRARRLDQLILWSARGKRIPAVPATSRP